MAGFITLEDGRAWSGANWAYDAVLGAIVDALNAQGDRDLATWLLQRTSQGPGVGTVDLREIAPADRTRFRVAVRAALAHVESTGPAGWNTPEFFPSWLEKFRVLAKMMDSEG